MSRVVTVAARAAAAALLFAAGAGGAACGGEGPARTAARAGETPTRFGVGRRASVAEVAAVDLDVNPAGVGLPPGQGTAADGAATYARKCAACHGARGEGIARYPRLVGREPREGFPFGNDPSLVKTVGNYWSHSTTLYDYVRRAMPLTEPGSLTPHEVYGVVAWLLAENEIIRRDAVMDARTLPAVRMPARDRFVPDTRRGGRELR